MISSDGDVLGTRRNWPRAVVTHRPWKGLTDMQNNNPGRKKSTDDNRTDQSITESLTGRLTGGPVPEDGKAVHVVCHDCVWESLVMEHCERDDVEARGEARVEDHQDATGHLASFEVVQG